MKVILKKIGIGIVIVCAIVVGTLYIWSWVIMNKTYDLPFTSLNIPTDTASIQEGARLVRIAHCKDCHGELFTGRVFREIPNKVKRVTPNVTQIVSSYSNEELELLIRHGIKKNKRSVFFMPSQMYYELKDESIAKIIAYLRTLKPLPSPKDLPAGHIFHPLGRLEIIKAQYMRKSEFFKGAADKIDHAAPQQYVNHDTTQVAFGKYLTMTACSNCHGKDLKGNPAGTPPNLIIAHAYTREQFIHLLKTGEGGRGKKDLGLMSIMAKDHFRYMNETEMNAIYSFLQTLGHQ
jgi:mono/diheme cytochrome c family protein